MSEELKILSEDVAHVFKALARLQQVVHELRAEQKALQRIETIKMFYETRLQLQDMRNKSEAEAEATQDLSEAIKLFSEAIKSLQEALHEPEEPVSQGDQGDHTNGKESERSEGIQPEALEEEPEGPEVYP